MIIEDRFITPYLLLIASIAVKVLIKNKLKYINFDPKLLKVISTEIYLDKIKNNVYT